MYQGLISRALFAGTTTWNIIWTLPIKPNQYEIHMILHYLAGRKIQYLGALGDVWSLATHSRRKVFLVKNSRNFVLICYSAQIPDIKWGETNGACIMWAKIPSSPFYARKAYFDPYPTSDLSVPVRTLKKIMPRIAVLKRKRLRHHSAGYLAHFWAKLSVPTNYLAHRLFFANFFSLSSII